jgi:hypothetical protein
MGSSMDPPAHSLRDFFSSQSPTLQRVIIGKARLQDDKRVQKKTNHHSSAGKTGESQERPSRNARQATLRADNPEHKP